MNTITNHQIIGLLIILFLSLLFFSPVEPLIDEKGLHLLAICFAAFLPAASYQLSRIQMTLNLIMIIFLSLLIGGLWYFIIKEIYPSTALVLGGIVACGNYLMLRME